MTTTPGTVACPFPTRPRRRASRPHSPSEGLAPPPAMPAGRVPRVARLLALAIRLEQLVQARVIANYAALAELGHVSRARVTQICRPTARGGCARYASTSPTRRWLS